MAERDPASGRSGLRPAPGRSGLSPAPGRSGLSRRSPLEHYADRLTAASGVELRIAEVPFVPQFTLRVAAKSPSFDAVGDALGFALPIEPNTVAGEPSTVAGEPNTVAGEPNTVVGEPSTVASEPVGVEAFWLGPDEWLVTGAVQDRLAGVLTVGALVDVSGQRTILEIAGPKAREVLAKGCRLDLHPRVFGAGQCAQTTYAKAPVVLVPRDGDGYWLLVRASFAEYLAEFLIDAVSEYR